MSRQLLFSRIVPFIAISAGLIAAVLLGDWVLHRLQLVWVGRYLGIPGTLLIAAAMGYSLRKRNRIRWGAPTRWLAFHQSVAWFGSLLVLLHAGVHFNSSLAWLATGAMSINVLSGLTGKFLLTSSRQVVGERRREFLAQGLSLEEAEARILWDSAAVRVMSRWRSLHIPIFVAFAALALGHIVSTLLFWDWR